MKSVVLGRFIFPYTNIVDCLDLYFKGNYIEVTDAKVVFRKGGVLSTATYINSFSYSKWSYYTVVDSVVLKFRIKGEFILRIKADSSSDRFSQSKQVGVYHLDGSNNCEIKIPSEYKDSVISWELEAVSDNSVFFESFYSSILHENLIKDVNLAIGICTFKREDFVIPLILKFQEAVNNKESVLYKKMDIYVADNGRTLDSSMFDSNYVYVYKNKNLGGAGGFTRCLIESLDSGKKYTNFIFLDDDVHIHISSIEKNFIFLALLKDEWKHSCIGGGLFSMDDSFLQFENGARWDNDFVFNKKDVDMRDYFNVVANEEIVKLDYNAWCYCCIPFEIVTDLNLPLPLFLHFDDVEYGIRNKLNVITLNGINVWHTYRRALVNPINDYYDVRNRLIFIALYNHENLSKTLRYYYYYYFDELFRFHYASVVNAMKGIIDFYKGVEFFCNYESIHLNYDLMNGSRWNAFDNMLLCCESSLGNKKLDGKRKRIVSFVKQYFSFPRKIHFVYDKNGILDCEKFDKICVYNQKFKKGIVYKRNFFSFMKALYFLFKVRNLMKLNIGIVADKYKENIYKIRTKQFWSNFIL